MFDFIARWGQTNPYKRWGRQAGVVGAVAVGVAVVGAVASANAQKHAAETAANAQTQAATSANATEMAMFKQEQSDLAPYQAMGTAAGGALMNLMGIADTSPKTALNAPNSINTSKPAKLPDNIGQPPPSTSGGSSGVSNTSTKGKAEALLTGGASNLGHALGIGFAQGGMAPKTFIGGEEGPELLHNASGTHVIGQHGPEIVHSDSPGFVQPNPATAARDPEAARNFMMAMRGGAPLARRALGGPVAQGVFSHNPIMSNPGMDYANPSAVTGRTPATPNPTGISLAATLAKHPVTGLREPGYSISKPGLGVAMPASSSATASTAAAPVGALPRQVANPQSTAPHPATSATTPLPSKTGATGATPGGTTSQQQADALLGQGLGAGYDPTTADSTSGKVLESSPQYQFALQQGIEGLDASAAASGGLLSGGHLAAILNYSQGLASQQYNNVYNQLMGVTSMGEAAAAGTASNALYTGMGSAGNIMQAGAGNAQAAYAIGNASSNMYSSIGRIGGAMYGYGGGNG